MIKVGQIYKSKAHGAISCITAKGKNEFFIISPDGSSNRLDIIIGSAVEKIADLIAEYPTWQEAVNSKEFKE